MLQLRDLGEGERVSAVLAYYAGYTPDCSPHSRRMYGTDEDMLTAVEVDTFWNYYISKPDDRNTPYTHGLLGDLKGLPPYYIGVGECDVLSEQNLAMAGKLLASGVSVDVKLYAGAPAQLHRSRTGVVDRATGLAGRRRLPAPRVQAGPGNHEDRRAIDRGRRFAVDRMTRP